MAEDCGDNNKHRTPIVIVESAMELMRNTKEAVQVCMNVRVQGRNR